MPETLSIVMLVHNRPRLTRQALESLVENTLGPFNLTIVDDGSTPENSFAVADLLCHFRVATHFLRYLKAQGPGQARNDGILASEQRFGRLGLLYLCDNDSYHLPGWDKAILEVWKDATARYKFRVLAGYCHPYNQTNQVFSTSGGLVHEKYAVGLLSAMMTWETYDKYGPFDPSPTTNGSEDFAFCQKVRAAGYRVGSIWPQPILNCGLTGSNGKLSPGSELMHNQAFPAGVIVE